MTALLSLAGSLRPPPPPPPQAINITHQCQVRSQLLVVLADYWLVCLQVWVFCIVFHDIMLSCKMWLVPHANDCGKVVMQPETDVSNELPLTLFDVIHPGLSVLSTDFTLQLTNIRDRDCTERDCLQPLIKMHSVILSSEMGLFCVKKLILQCICNHWPAVFISTSRSQWIESGLHTPVAWLCRHAGFMGGGGGGGKSHAQKTEGVHY